MDWCIGKGLTESPWGGLLQRTTRHDGRTSAHVIKGKMPIGEVHERPPELPDTYPRGSITSEHFAINPKGHVRAYQAQRPIPDEGARARPEP